MSIALDRDRIAYSVAEAADALSIHRATMHRLIAEGEIEARKLHRRTVILRAELERYANALPLAGEAS
jgi:excisionase family DNA binding protein